MIFFRTSLAGVLVWELIFSPAVFSDCKCHQPNKADITRAGANLFVLKIEKEPYRRIEGTVNAFVGEAMENVLVEVFDHPDYLLGDNPLREPPKRKKVAACATAADGKFCFRNLPPGKYELRSSISGGWNITHIYVVVDQQHGRNQKIEVEMSLGI